MLQFVTGKVALSINVFFNVFIEKLTCSNTKRKKKELLTSTGGVLNSKDVLINNVLADSNIKYSKSEKKDLFLIYSAVAEIQNMLIKDSTTSVKCNITYFQM